ncbi:hypothetical protein Trydic_g21709 [Trypoxylus dichotomus]
MQKFSDDLKIRAIVVRWPNATHDQTIFNNSNPKHEFENGRFGRFLLLSDSGYNIQPYLMTKLQEARTTAENLYNESIIRTRNVIERQYGVWKRRFPILQFGMRLNLDRVIAIVVATAVLHNIAIHMKDTLPNEEADFVVDDHEEQPDNVINVNNARHRRQLIINEHFARL